MQDTEKPDFHSEALRIGADFEHGCGTGFKQETKERPLVLPDERHQLVWNAEDDVEVVHGQQFILPRAQPLLSRVRLTLGTVAISARNGVHSITCLMGGVSFWGVWATKSAHSNT